MSSLRQVREGDGALQHLRSFSLRIVDRQGVASRGIFVSYGVSGHREVGLGVMSAHRNRRFIVGSSCLFGCFKCPKPHPSFPVPQIRCRISQYV
ncbi:hypothetical protein V6N11_032000 [Hibiscus sabdariffa]|uniref:Uncharacterized protein n=1 Tax=Hibiscus sabdariffa TaxID=183260 RepID=A0ABR2T022_9ROSI